MTKAEAAAFKERWRLVNERQLQELREMSIEEKFKQLAALMASVDAMGWSESLKEGEEEVRERWMRLKAFYNV